MVKVCNCVSQIYGSADAETVVSQQVSKKRRFSAVDALEENFVEVHFTEDSAGGMQTLLQVIVWNKDKV